MAETKLSDILIPEIWNPYVVERSTELSALWSSGIVAVDARVAPGMRNGGETVNMPYFADLTGDAEELSDQKSLSVASIAASQDVSVVQALGRAWGVNDLAPQLAGADPMRAIGDLVAAFWARQYQKRLIKTLTGAFGAASMSGNIHDISGESGDASIISRESVHDAIFKLGDAFENLTAIAVHSAVYSKLVKDDMLDTIKGSDNAAFRTYQGRRVIVDDSLPVANGVYTTYIFGQGAVAYVPVPVKTPVETDRDSLAGVDYLIHRNAFILHIRGVKWIGTATIATGDDSSGHPTATELATGTNWTRVYDNKAIRVVAHKHKIA